MRLNQDNKNYVSTLPEYYTNDITLLEVKDDIDKFLDFRDLQIEYGTPEYADFLSELTTEKYRNNLSEVTRRYYRAFASVYLANVDLGGIDLERTVDGRTI